MDFHTLTGKIQAEVQQTLATVDDRAVGKLKQAIIDAPRIFVSGKGRTGLHMQAFAMRLMHLGLPVHALGEATTPAIQSQDLLLIGSGSGRTEALVGYATKAKQVGATIGLLAAVETAPLVTLADYVVRIPSQTKQAEGQPSVLPMGSLFELTLSMVLDIIVLQLMDELNITSDQMYARHANLE
jgi:6-phospho-3-hexuloisomerase